MNSRLEDLMYRAGLTAQGCWDSMDDYDHKAIEKFAELIVLETINCATHIEGIEAIKQHFGINNN